MRRFVVLALALSLALCLTASATLAARKAAPKKPAKPAWKKPVPKKPTGGTVQLPGGAGKFGTVYSLRKSNPLYFRLVKAEYTTDQVVVGERTIEPAANEKLLVLHFTIQNPQKSEQFVRWDSLVFTAVDKTDANHDGREDWGEEADGKSFGMSMKPAQTTALFTAFKVPAKGIMPKLMVLPGNNDGPVLRYDLTDPANKVEPLKAPTADPADPTGYTALETVPGEIGAAYPYGDLDITVEKYEYLPQIADERPDKNTRFFVATLLIRNDTPRETFVRWDRINPILSSTDGEKLRYKNMLLATANRSFGQSIPGKSDVHVRIYFAIPTDATAGTLALKEGQSRTYEFKVQ